MLKALLHSFSRLFPISNERYISQLRKKGARIGKGTVFFSPRKTLVDEGKSFLISIGDYCKITSGVVILAHDYSRSVVRYCYGENVGGSAPVRIGNNCFIGMNTTILMGTQIGENCVIGAGSVVHGSFPANCVIAGAPARVICSLEEFYEKRKGRALRDACACVKACRENTGRLPTVRQMGDGFAWLYLPHTQETVEQYPSFFNLAGDDPTDVKACFLREKAQFESFEAFLKYAEEKIERGEV